MTQKEDPRQLDLPLAFPELNQDQPLLPVRMVNEYQYCPRLAYLEWVQGEWASSADTVQGTHAHRRVDKPGGKLPAPEDVEQGETIHARSVTLSSNKIGIIAKLDLIEEQDGEAIPVDYKRGKRPHIAKGVYDPERVQLCAQGMLLAEHGYNCNSGVIYYVASKERVRVPFDDELRQLTQSAIDGMRLLAAAKHIPPPLEDSPKCPRCSLVGICLPDEVGLLQHGSEQPPRPLAISRDEALPVYVQAWKAKVAKSGQRLTISVDDDKPQEVRLIDVSQLVLQGNIYLTTPCLHELMKRGINVSWHTFGGWFRGHTIGSGHNNIELRIIQHRHANDEKFCLRLARTLVANKIHNCRILLRRNWRDPDTPPAELMQSLKEDIAHARRAKSLQQLLGVEGAAAARYFGAFSKLIKPDPSNALAFDFTHRNRRPPADPVNAMLSFAYSMLVRHFTVTASAVGLEAYLGFYHQPRFSRPALALDLMEPFRPLLADSAVIQAINNQEVRATDFINIRGASNLTPDGRKRFIAAFERRLDQEFTHPVFGYRISYRRTLEVQCRLLARHLLGELPDYPELRSR